MSASVASLVRQILDQYQEKDGEFSTEEWTEIAKIVEIVPKFPKIPSPLFLPVMSRNVPACVELVLIRKGKVLLTHRKDKFFEGHHTPGTYIAPGESFCQAAQRCADRELKVRIKSAKSIASENHPDSIRFHDQSTLVHCEFEGEPNVGEWFNEMPADLLKVHKSYWKYIQPLLF